MAKFYYAGALYSYLQKSLKYSGFSPCNSDYNECKFPLSMCCGTFSFGQLAGLMRCHVSTYKIKKGSKVLQLFKCLQHLSSR